MNKCVQGLSTILLILMLTGCHQTVPGNQTVPDNQPMPDNQPVKKLAEESSAAKYHDYRESIDKFYNQYMNFIYDEEGDKEDSDIFVESGIVLDSSTEGSQLTRYSTQNDEILRYRWKLMGETGNTEYNYYLVDQFVYIQVLNTRYALNIFLIDEIDNLYYELKEYIIDGDTAYLVDDTSEMLMSIDNEELEDIHSLQKVEALFEEMEITETYKIGMK